MLLIAALLAACLQLSSAPAPPSPPKAHDPTPTVGEVIVVAPIVPREPDWSKKLNLDPKGEFGSSDTPYLRQRPTKGCKVMAGVAKSPEGKSGAAGGLVCARLF